VSILRRITNPAAEKRGAADIPSNSQLALRSSAGQIVTPDTALRLSTWWACVNLLADLVSTLRLGTYRDADGRRLEVAAPPLLMSPSTQVSLVQWLRQIMVSMLTRGNAWGLVTGIDGWGRPSGIEIIDPDFVSFTRKTPLGPVEFYVLGQRLDRYPLGPLWHLPAFVIPSWPIGLSPVSYAAQSIGLGLAAEQFGADWFGNGGHPTALLKSDQPVDGDQADTAKTRWRQALAEDGGIAVLGSGLDYKSVQIAPEESQFLETTKANVATIARYFRIPPEMVGGEAGNSLTYANVEQRSLDFLTYTLQPWLVKLEEALTALTSAPTCVRFDVDELLRVDAKTRAEISVMRTRAGEQTQNEARARENLEPLPDGDRLNWPPFRVTPDPAEPDADDAGEPDDDDTDPAGPAPAALPEA